MVTINECGNHTVGDGVGGGGGLRNGTLCVFMIMLIIKLLEEAQEAHH